MVVKAQETSEALFDGATFKNPTGFKEVDAKAYRYNILKAGTGDEILSSQRIDVRAGGIYTIVISGLENPPAGNKNTLRVDVL